LGSGSSRIAADIEGFEFTGFELDKDYFDASVKRFNEYKLQTKLL
jgi:site-specific DNA-methyltransferase (adenine-specific)